MFKVANFTVARFYINFDATPPIVSIQFQRESPFKISERVFCLKNNFFS